MARDQNAFAEMQREMEKKRKAQDKRERRGRTKGEARGAAVPTRDGAPDEEV